MQLLSYYVKVICEFWFPQEQEIQLMRQLMKDTEKLLSRARRINEVELWFLMHVFVYLNRRWGEGKKICFKLVCKPYFYLNLFGKHFSLKQWFLNSVVRSRDQPLPDKYFTNSYVKTKVQRRPMLLDFFIKWKIFPFRTYHDILFECFFIERE